MKNRRGNFFFLCRERLKVVTGNVQSVPVRRLTACKYMEHRSFPADADDFPRGRNDSYIDVKCCNRMPQPLGGCAVIGESVVPLVGSTPVLPCRWAFP